MDKFYCSQLVWRSWFDVNGKYELSNGPEVIYVAPADLANSPCAELLVSYNNKE